MKTNPCKHCGGTGRQPDPVALGKNLKTIRDGSGLTLRALGERLDLTAAYLCDIEHGRRRCPPALEKRWRRACR